MGGGWARYSCLLHPRIRSVVSFFYFWVLLSLGVGRAAVAFFLEHWWRGNPGLRLERGPSVVLISFVFSVSSLCLIDQDLVNHNYTVDRVVPLNTPSPFSPLSVRRFGVGIACYWEFGCHPHDCGHTGEESMSSSVCLQSGSPMGGGKVPGVGVTSGEASLVCWVWVARAQWRARSLIISAEVESNSGAGHSGARSSSLDSNSPSGRRPVQTASRLGHEGGSFLRCLLVRQPARKPSPQDYRH